MLKTYQPKSFKEFYNNEAAIARLQSFFESDEEYNHMIIGPTGGGKTTLCKLLFDQYSSVFSVYRPCYESFESHKDMINNINNYIKSYGIHEMLSKKKKLLFLDDIDSLYNTNRYANTILIDILTQRRIKVLLTCTYSMEKKTGDLKKHLKVTYIQNPSLQNVFNIITLVYPNLLDKLSSQNLIDYIETHECNVRNCLTNITFLNEESINENKDTILTFDQGIIKIVEKIFLKHSWNLELLELWISNEPALISYIMYDNFTHFVSDMVSIQNILSTFTQSSILETYIYMKNDWLLFDIMNLWRIGMIKYHVNDHFKDNKLDMKYTTIPTRVSNYYSSIKKNGQSTSISFPYLSRDDILFASSLNLVDGNSVGSFSKKIINIKQSRYLKKQ